MGNKIQDKEKVECRICKKEFFRSVSYMPEKRRTVCSGKCRLIAWAEKVRKEMDIKEITK